MKLSDLNQLNRLVELRRKLAETRNKMAKVGEISIIWNYKEQTEFREPDFRAALDAFLEDYDLKMVLQIKKLGVEVPAAKATDAAK